MTPTLCDRGRASSIPTPLSGGASASATALGTAPALGERETVLVRVRRSASSTPTAR